MYLDVEEMFESLLMVLGAWNPGNAGVSTLLVVEEETTEHDAVSIAKRCECMVRGPVCRLPVWTRR